MQRLKEVFYIGSLLGIFFLRFRYSRVFITMSKCRCVTQQQQISTNSSLKTQNFYWHCTAANPGRNRRVGPKIISWASGLNSFLGRYQVGFSKAAINLQSQIASQLNTTSLVLQRRRGQCRASTLGVSPCFRSRRRTQSEQAVVPCAPFSRGVNISSGRSRTMVHRWDRISIQNPE